jgi:L-lactate dehydrogenase
MFIKKYTAEVYNRKRNMSVIKVPTIAIIGAGSVGSTTAYALMLANTNTEIILVDINQTRCTGETLDLSDALAFCTTHNIRMGTAQEVGQADIIIIAAGQKQSPGQSRRELLVTNRKIVSQVIKSAESIKKDAIIIIVTNPVDILTGLAQELVHLPKNQIFGSGTYLDTQRLRGLLATQLNIARDSIDVYVIGEHGDSQVCAWSNAHINGTPLLQFPDIQKADLPQIAQKTREYAYKIIECKGSTYYGIAACVARICNIILYDKKEIIPISWYHKEYDACFSLPAIVGRNGVEKIIPINLDTAEQQQLQQSIEVLNKLK